MNRKQELNGVGDKPRLIAELLMYRILHYGSNKKEKADIWPKVSVSLLHATV